MADLTGFENRKKYTENESFVRPLFSQMTPFKPEHHPVPSKHGVAGGNFPAPPAASRLMRMMPPPRCFLGPFVIVDQLLDKMRGIELPNKNIFVQAIKTGDVDKKIKIKQENMINPENAQNFASVQNGAVNGSDNNLVNGSSSLLTGSKRGMAQNDDDKQNEEVDIYTMRQKNKRLKI